MFIRTRRVLAFRADLPQSFSSVLFFSACLLIVMWMCWPDGTQAQDASATPAQAVTALETGKPVERELAGGQRHNFQLMLSAKQLLNVITEQRGIDVAVSLFGPDGEKLLELDSPNGAVGEEAFAVIAERPGTYQIEVRALEEKATQGQYLIRVASLVAASERDYQFPGLAKPIVRELVGGQTHNYDIIMSNDEYLYLVAEQRGIDIILTLFGPDGKQITEVDSPNGTQGIEPLNLVTDHAGTYRLEVRSPKKDAKPGRYGVKIGQLRKAMEKDRALVESEKLKLQANKLESENKFTEAISLRERASELLEKALGSSHVSVANSIHNLAFTQVRARNYSKAVPLYEKSLQLYQKLLSPEHPYIANNLHNLGRAYLRQNNFKKAALFYQQALAIRERILVPGHNDIASTLFNLGYAYRMLGAYSKAEPLLQRASDIWEGLDHPEVTTSRINLAEMYYEWGDYRKAELTHLKTLELFTKAKDPDSFSMDKGVFLLDLGVVYLDLENYSKAEQLLLQALDFFAKTKGPECTDVGLTLINLGLVHQGREDYSRAEECFLRSKAIYDKAGRVRADLLTDFGYLYLAKGEGTKAEPFFHEAIKITEEKFGPYEPELCYRLSGLALTKHAQQAIDQTITTMSRVSEIQEREVIQNLLAGSERQMLLALNRMADTNDIIFTLLAKTARTNPQAMPLAASALFNRKGRVMDTMTGIFEAMRQRATPEEQKLFERFVAERNKLATLQTSGAGTKDPASHRSEVRSQMDLVERIEVQITARDQDFRAQFQSIKLSDLQPLLPAKAALVEFVRYYSFNFRTAKRMTPHYAALVLPANGSAAWVELGEAEPIEQAVSYFRQALSNPRRSDVQQLARRLDERIMRPIRALTGDAQRILVSPDGALNLVPFAGLVDEQKHYLANRYSFTYLTSGRDLLRLQNKHESTSEIVVMANPAFDSRPFTVASAHRDIKPVHNSVQSFTAAFDFAGADIQPLPGTADEARALRQLMPEAKVFEQTQASETALRQINRPRILHIATHGFFLPDLKLRVTDTREESSTVADSRIENPLLRSGLLLAGVKTPKGENDNGVLTALEATGLDLWGTKIVILSACNTGVGEVKNGEGVYGLRRAFVLAGSETQLMSLWSVSDRGTKELMVEYYKRLLRGEGRGEALRQVQLQMLKIPNRRHPYYWASFIQSGEWANLEGKR